MQPGKDRHTLLRREYVEKYGEENADYLMEMEQGWMKEYNNAAYVDLGFSETRRYKDYTRECAQWLGWQCDELEGEPSLVKRFVDGEWDESSFLVVEPGASIVPYHDDMILKQGC